MQQHGGDRHVGEVEGPIERSGATGTLLSVYIRDLDQTDSVLVGLMTGVILEAPIYRVTVEPTSSNGLQKTSQIMVEKILAVPRRKCSDPVGRLTTDQISALDHKLSVVIGLADR